MTQNAECDPDSDPTTAHVRAALRELPTPSLNLAASVTAHLNNAQPERRYVWFLATAFGCVVLVSLLLTMQTPRLGAKREDAFFMRGKLPTKTQAFSVYVAPAPNLPAEPLGAHLQRNAVFSFSLYRGEEAPPFTMIYAIDSAREVHWFYPSYIDPNTDPKAVTFHTEGWALLPDAVRISDLTPGALTLVLLGSSEPLTVSDVEAAIGQGRSAPAAASLSVFTTTVDE